MNEDKFYTIFNNRVDKDCKFLRDFSWRIPMPESTREITIPTGESRRYANSSIFDSYAPYEEIACVADEKQPALFRVVLTSRPGFVEPKKGFSILFYQNTPLQIQAYSASWGNVCIPYQVPIVIHNVPPSARELYYSEIRFGAGETYVKRQMEDREKVEEIRRQQYLHPLSFPKTEGV